MTDSATLQSWLEPLGLGGADSGLEVRRSNTETWEVVHERRIPESLLSSDWQAPWDTERPAAVVGEAARDVARGFPLVESETQGDGGDVTVQFRAPIFDEGVTRQGVALTVSAVLKAAQVFDLVLTRRAQEMADWREFEAGSEQRKQEQEQLINQMAEAGTTSDATEPAPVAPVPRSDDTAPAPAWSPTHVVTRRADAWAQPDPSGARAGTVKRRVEVQVLERQGDWAQVVTSNGWSGWIDNHDLKVR
jgi:hypothetical protein